MRSISVSRSIPASEQAVWDVLADFPNIADWNTGVKTSYATGDATDGVGATRHCDLSPTGVLEETIRVWEPTERMVISIDATKRLPIKRGEVTFELDGDTDTTSIELSYDYETRFGPIGKLMGPMIDKQLTSGFDGFLADLDTAATV